MTMDISKIKRRKRGDGVRKNKLINIRITPKLSKWMREKDYSPTGIFMEATRELGYVDEEK